MPTARQRLKKVKKRADEEVADLLSRFPKFRDTHEQPTTEREYGAFWSLDILYWVQDYCEGFIDEYEED